MPNLFSLLIACIYKLYIHIIDKQFHSLYLKDNSSLNKPHIPAHESNIRQAYNILQLVYIVQWLPLNYFSYNFLKPSNNNVILHIHFVGEKMYYSEK